MQITARTDHKAKFLKETVCCFHGAWRFFPPSTKSQNTLAISMHCKEYTSYCFSPPKERYWIDWCHKSLCCETRNISVSYSANVFPNEPEKKAILQLMACSPARWARLQRHFFFFTRFLWLGAVNQQRSVNNKNVWGRCSFLCHEQWKRWITKKLSACQLASREWCK